MFLIISDDGKHMVLQRDPEAEGSRTFLLGWEKGSYKQKKKERGSRARMQGLLCGWVRVYAA